MTLDNLANLIRRLLATAGVNIGLLGPAVAF